MELAQRLRFDVTVGNTTSTARGTWVKVSGFREVKKEVEDLVSHVLQVFAYNMSYGLSPKGGTIREDKEKWLLNSFWPEEIVPIEKIKGGALSVGELIASLQKFNPESLVIVDGICGGYDAIVSATRRDVKDMSTKKSYPHGRFDEVKHGHSAVYLRSNRRESLYSSKENRRSG
jgi:hypothetical protein